MYEEDLELNNVQLLICHKPKQSFVAITKKASSLLYFSFGMFHLPNNKISPVKLCLEEGLLESSDQLIMAPLA